MKKLTRILTLAMALMLFAGNALALNAQESTLYSLVKEDRARYGLNMPVLDAELSRIARIKAEDMLSNNYFAHTSPTYGNIRKMLKTFGYSYSGASENIARSRSVYHSEAAFLSSSSGHRTTLLGKSWTHMGVGVATTRNGFVYVVQIFARK